MSSRLPNNVKTWFIVGVSGAALITAGAASAAGFRPAARVAAPAAAAPAGGGVAAAPAGGRVRPAPAPAGGGVVAAPAGGGKIRLAVPAPVPAAAPAPAPIGGGAGAINALMQPTVPLTAVGGANESPTAPGALTASVGTLRITLARGLSASLTNMDPARFPVGCAATAAVNGTVAGAVIAPAVAPAVGNAVAVHAAAGPTGTNHVSLDVTCTVSTATRAGVVTSTHQTHWVGTI